MQKHNSCLCQSDWGCCEGAWQVPAPQLGWPRDTICLIIVVAAHKPASVLFLTRTTAHRKNKATKVQRARSGINRTDNLYHHWILKRTCHDTSRSLRRNTVLPAWHSCYFSLWSHDISCYWSTCSNTFRNWKIHTHTSPVVPKDIHLDDTVIFLLACFFSFRFSVFQELLNIVLLQVMLLIKVTYL